MLESVFIIRHIIVIVVGVCEEIFARSKHITGAEVWRGKLSLARLFYDVDVARRVVEVLAELVAQVRVRVAVAHNLHRLRAAYAAVVGGYDHATIVVGERAQQVCHHRVAEPAERATACR